MPNEDPALRCTFAFFTNQRSTIVSGVTGFMEDPRFLLASAACAAAPILSENSLTSSQERYVPCGLTALTTGCIFSRRNPAPKSSLPSRHPTPHFTPSPPPLEPP